MSFTISAPWEGNTGSVSNIVLGGGAPGGRVPVDEAKTRRQATACWAGTTRTKAVIQVSVARVTVEGCEGPTKAALAWASPTVPTIGPLDSTSKGGLGNQDAYFC
jgi:hypothetical protein